MQPLYNIPGTVNASVSVVVLLELQISGYCYEDSYTVVFCIWTLVHVTNKNLRPCFLGLPGLHLPVHICALYWDALF